MNNSFFGKTTENVIVRTNVEFIDPSQIDLIIIRQSKLSFKGIINWYMNFSVYKFDKEKTVFDKPKTNIFGLYNFRTIQAINICIKLKTFRTKIKYIYIIWILTVLFLVLIQTNKN